jgi:hypothetical protein
MGTERIAIRDVISRVRELMPDVTRDQLGERLRNHFPDDAEAINWELDLAFGITSDADG